MDNQDNKKRASAFHAGSVRDLVDFINEAGIQKEDIVQVVGSEDGMFLIYYT